MVNPIIHTLGLCSGVGMLEEGVRLGCEYFGLRAEPALLCEWEGFAEAVLMARMEESSLAGCPIETGDLAEFDARSFRGLVDIVTAGFPCQPWSCAGARLGTDDERWLWPAIARIIGVVGPGLVFLENVPGLISGGGLEYVLSDLAALGFDAEWTNLEAAEVDASHKRERIFILAYRAGRRFRELWQSPRLNGQSFGCNETMGHTIGSRSHAIAARSGSRSSIGEPSGSVADAECAGLRRQRHEGAGTLGRTEAVGAGEVVGDSSGAGSDGHDRGGGQVSSLRTDSANWSIPASRDYRSPDSAESQANRAGNEKRTQQLANQIEHQFLPQDQEATGVKSRRTSTRRLNPAFVCWLMGWPWWWTRAEPISFAAEETELWRSNLRRRLSDLFNEQSNRSPHASNSIHGR